jgi:hypothetical protein
VSQAYRVERRVQIDRLLLAYRVSAPVIQVPLRPVLVTVDARGRWMVTSLSDCTYIEGLKAAGVTVVPVLVSREESDHRRPAVVFDTEVEISEDVVAD